MATAVVTLGQCGVRGQFGDMPVMIGPYQSETITTSGASAPGTKSANKFDVAQVFCATAVYAIGAAAPVVTAATGLYCPAGVPTWLFLQPGDKIALIDG